MNEGYLATALLIAYFLILLSIGLYTRKSSKKTREDYFLASRNFGTWILFFSVIGTVASAFTILGFPGQVYRTGLPNFGSIAGSAVLIIPITFATVGVRLWYASQKFNHITPGQLLNHRYNSDYLGPISSILMIFWTIPYLVLGGLGSGLAIESLTGGIISYAVGAGAVITVVTIYLILGGMRGSGYTDLIQGTLVISLMIGFTLYTLKALGGVQNSFKSAIESNPELISRSSETLFTTEVWLSTMIMMGFSVVMYPQVILRIFTGKSLDSVKKMVVLFPVGMLVLFLCSTVLGFIGTVEVTNLEGDAADNIVPVLIGILAPEYIAAFALIIIIAAIMSSLDSQSLSVSTLISEDLLRNLDTLDDSQIIKSSKLLTIGLMLIVFLLTLIEPGSIFFLVEFAFQGYALMFYPIAAGLYWRECTEKGVITGLLFGFVGLLVFQTGLIPSSWSLGFMPLIPLLALQIIIVHLTSHCTQKPPEQVINSYFKSFEEAW